MTRAVEFPAVPLPNQPALTTAGVSETSVKGRGRAATGADMSFLGLFQLGLSTAIFLLAATVAKHWALAPNLGKLALTLAL